MGFWTKLKLHNPSRIITRFVLILTCIEITRCTVKQDSQYKCIALRFLNHAGGNFRVISTMKPEGYQVTTDEYKLKTIFRHSQLRHFVIFHGADDENKKEIFLDGEKTISVSPQTDCEHYSDVIVTSKLAPQKTGKSIKPFTETRLPNVKPPLVLKKAPETKKSTTMTVEDADKKGKITEDEDEEQNKEVTEAPEGVPTTFDRATNMQPTANFHQLSYNHSPKNDKVLQNDLIPLTALSEHLFTANDDDDTNMTYVDEDLDNDNTMSNHRRPERKNQNNRKFSKNKNKNYMPKFTRLKNKEMHQKAIKDEKNLLKKMLPLILKYQSARLEKTQSKMGKYSKSALLSKELEDNVSTSEHPEFQQSILTKIDGRGTATDTPPESLNNINVSAVSFLNDILNREKQVTPKKKPVSPDYMEEPTGNTNAEIFSSMSSLQDYPKTSGGYASQTRVENAPAHLESFSSQINAKSFTRPLLIGDGVNRNMVEISQTGKFIPSPADTLHNTQPSTAFTTPLFKDSNDLAKTGRNTANVSVSTPKNLSYSEHTKSTWQRVDQNPTIPKAVHHTSLIHKDTRVDIVNELQDNSTLADKDQITKPRFIHTKAEAIEEIVKALGNNTKIVKDANGLYLITGERVRIIHLTHTRKAETHNESTQLSKSSKHRLGRFQEVVNKTRSVIPILEIRTRKPSESLQGFSESVLHDIKKKVGLSTSTYNLDDLKEKLQSKFQRKDKGKDENEYLLQTEKTRDRKVSANKARRQGAERNRVKYLGGMKHITIKNIQAAHHTKNHSTPKLLGENDNKISGFQEDSKKGNENEENGDKITVLPKNSAVNLTKKDKMKFSQKLSLKLDEADDGFQILSFDGGLNFHKSNKKSFLQNEDEPINTNDISDLPVAVLRHSSRDISRDSLHDESHDIVRDSRNSSWNSLHGIPKVSTDGVATGNEVHVEVVDEGKKFSRIEEDTTPSKPQENDEDIEIVDEDNDSNASSEKPSVYDISLALYEKYGKKDTTTERPFGTMGMTQPTESERTADTLRNTEKTWAAGRRGTSPLETSKEKETMETLGTTGSQRIPEPIVESTGLMKGTGGLSEIPGSLGTTGVTESTGTNELGKSDSTRKDETSNSILSRRPAMQKLTSGLPAPVQPTGRVTSEGIKASSTAKAPSIFLEATSAPLFNVNQSSGVNEQENISPAKNGLTNNKKASDMKDAERVTQPTLTGTTTSSGTIAPSTPQSSTGSLFDTTNPYIKQLHNRDAQSDGNQPSISQAEQPETSEVGNMIGQARIPVIMEGKGNGTIATPGLQDTKTHIKSLNSKQLPVFHYEAVGIPMSPKVRKQSGKANRQQQTLEKEIPSPMNTFVGSQSQVSAKLPDTLWSSGTNQPPSPEEQKSRTHDTTQNMGPLLTEDIQNSFSFNYGPALNDGSKGTPGTSNDINNGREGVETIVRPTDNKEPMIPKRIVDKLLAQVIKDFRERSNQKFNGATKDNHQRTQTDRLDGNSKSSETTKNRERNDGGKFHKKAKKVSDMAKLDSLPDSFVKLLHRHLKKKHKTRKPKPKKIHHEVLDTNNPTEDAMPLIRYQERLLEKQQQKLEQQLNLENEVLDGKKLQDFEEMNSLTGTALGTHRVDGKESSGGKDEPNKIKSRLKTKIRELNKEKQRLINKLKLIRFQEQIKSSGGEYVSKETKPHRRPSVTDVYDRESGTAPYMNSRITYNAVKDEGVNKNTGEHSGTSYHELEHVSSFYDHPTTATEEYTTTASKEPPTVAPEGEEARSVGRGRELLTESGKGQFFLGPVGSKNLGKSDFLLYNTPVTTGSYKPSNNPMGNKETDGDYTMKTPGPDLHQSFQNGDVLHLSSPSPSVPVHPTPSFINKEANYASNTADMFVYPFLNQEPSHKGKNQEFIDGSKTQNVIGMVNEQQHEIPEDTTGSLKSHAMRKTPDVFPGSYTYAEDPMEHQGIPRSLQWRREDAQLLKEMPEYAPQDNTIESKPQLGQYAVLTQRTPSEFKAKPQVTATITSNESEESDDKENGNEHEDRGDYDNENDENEDDSEVKKESGFDVEDEEGVPTITRNTDNPEDGVQDQTIINGDEYHLQKKYGIGKRGKKNKVKTKI